VLAHSREIAIQLHEYLALLAQSYESVHDKTVLAIGGIDLKEQRKVLLVKRPKVVVATLGRLLEMINKEYIGLERL
jgi:superfamily II DNA/RNA helicase